MEMTRYEPIGLRPIDPSFNRWDTPFERLVRNFFGDTDETSITTSRWMPLVDIRDGGDHFALEVDVPGVKAEDISITMENGVLNIEGQRSHEERTEEKGYTRVERAFGSFHRRFSLPETADGDRIEAKVDNGVLRIKIGKSEKARPRRIEVKS